MTVSKTICYRIKAHKAGGEYLFEFSDSEALTKGILEIYKNVWSRKLRSRLYKMPESYRLIVTGTEIKERLFVLNEFCAKMSDSKYEIASTAEYGKPLILKNAIFKYGKAFFKEI